MSDAWNLKPRPELDVLISRLCAGDLAPDQAAELAALLENDVQARESYVVQLNLHAELMWQLSEARSHANVPHVGKSTPLVGVLGPATSFNRPLIWSMLAASVLFAAYFTAISWNMWGREQPERREMATHESDAPTKPAVAKISDAGGAVWANKSAAKWTEPDVTAGEPLQIESGVVRLTLKQGTVLTVQAPAEWSVTGDNQAHLKRGKIIAHVPLRATGFTLDTPFSRVVDLGTEFGVEVNESGASDVHVIKGRIDVQLVAETGKRKLGVVKAGQTMTIDKDGAKLIDESKTPDKFQRLVNEDKQRLEKQRGYEVLFHYRMGEDDKDAKAGELAAEQTVGTGTLGSLHPLTRVGKPKYSGVTAKTNSTLAVRCTGNEAEGFLGKDYADLPTDNCVLEARVRPRSVEKGQVLVYLGDPARSGYGLTLANGKWHGLHGGLKVFSATENAPANEWTHVAWVRERGHLQLYVNGVPNGPEAIASCNPPAPIVSIGQISGPAPQAFDGEIDEVRLIRLKNFFRTEMFLNRDSTASAER